MTVEAWQTGPMRIAFTRLTEQRHRLEICRADGSAEAVELETRSVLLHDLVHYAVEVEAGIEDGFWGLLAHGTTMAALSEGTMSAPPSAGIALAERLVGPMQSVWQGRFDPALYVERFRPVAPGIVDAGFVDRVRDRLRALWGHWRATPFRSVMELTWPPSGPRTRPSSLKSPL
jgi:hypothetical protein